MASSINASTSGAGGVITTADNTGILNLQTAGTNAVTVDASQRVGIGTTSPNCNFQVNGVVRAATDNDKGVFSLGESAGAYSVNVGLWRGGANSAVSISTGIVTTGGNFLNLGGYDGIAFTTGAANIGSQTERMRIDSSGKLIMASVADGTLGTIQAGITANTGSTNAIIAVAANSNGAYPFGARGESTNQGLVGFFNSSNSVIGSVTKSGNNVAYNTSSDYRLKENIVPMTGALNKVAQLKPVTYTWKEDGSSGQGFIAHELQEVISDAVFGEKDAVDAKGNPKYQGVDTSFLVATLTAAIQEQQTIINDLKARVTALEAK